MSRADVVIVGAGVAGLAAARALVDGGLSTVVLEARARIGGRLHTERSWPRIAIELGASWIHGARHNPVAELANELGLRTREMDWDDACVYLAGRPLDDAEHGRIYRRWDKVVRLALAEHGPDGPLGDAIARAAAKLPPDAQQDIEFAIATEIVEMFGADAGELSRAYCDEGRPVRGGDLLVLDGYDAILRGLSPGVDVRLEHVVSAIRHDADGVVVTTDRGEVEAARAIVTLPIGVLKAGAIAFDPPLPPAKTAAIARLGAAVLDKLYLRFPRSFWPAHELVGRLGPPHGELANLYNLEVSFGEPVIMCLHGGSTARRIEAMTDDAIAAMAIARLREMFGAAVVEPEAVIATRWQLDPFARCSYSYLPPHATPADREALAAPIAQRVFFAGEATERDYPSTIRGALASGRRAAKRILAQPAE